MKENKKFVIALGGSVICPKEIDKDYLKRFFQFIKKEVKKGRKFIIVTGGGYTARNYQAVSVRISRVSKKDRDWLGVYATRLNARLLKAIFKKEAHPFIFDKRFKIKTFGKHSVIIGSGWQPGNSTDYVAVRIAGDFKIKRVIILGKPDHVYTGDFEKDKKARPIKKITWKDYLKLVPSSWLPGLSAPIDPIAARLAKKENMEVIVANGKDLNNLKMILEEKKFKGTIVKPKHYESYILRSGRSL